MFGWKKKAKATPDQYLSDQPITRRAMDRFNRAPFASTIADAMARRVDPSSNRLQKISSRSLILWDLG